MADDTLQPPGAVEEGGPPGRGGRGVEPVGSTDSWYVDREPVKPTEVRGQRGTAVYSGFVLEHEDDPDLFGRERYRTYSEIVANVPILGAGIRLFAALTSGARWHVDASEADADAAWAERAERCLMDDPMESWGRIVRRAANYRLYGFSIQEWTMRRTEGAALTFDRIEARPQITIERWDLDVAARTPLRGVVQRAPQDSQEIWIPRSKLLYVVDDSLSDSPEGLGLLRHCVAPAWRLLRYYQLEGWGYEADLRGVPVATAPLAEIRDPSLTQADQRQTLEGVEIQRKFIERHIRSPRLGLQLDSDVYRAPDTTPTGQRKWNMEVLRAGGTSQAALSAAIDRSTAEIARILGVDGMLLGTMGGGSGGAYALSRDKTATFHLLVNSALSEVRDSVERDLLGALWSVNGWPEEMRPSLRIEAVRQRDVEQAARSLVDIATAGAPITPGDPAVDDVREMAGLSPTPADAEPVPEVPSVPDPAELRVRAMEGDE